MNTFWKWLAVAGCGVGLLVAADRLRVVRADDDAPAYDRSGGGDSLDRLDRIVEKLGRVVERMEHGGPPPHDRPRIVAPRTTVTIRAASMATCDMAVRRTAIVIIPVPAPAPARCGVGCRPR